MTREQILDSLAPLISLSPRSLALHNPQSNLKNALRASDAIASIDFMSVTVRTRLQDHRFTTA
jgi:hypothetical protein